jgi:hypothetical protein
MSASKKGENHPLFGKTQSEETRAKMSVSKKGENNPMFGYIKKNTGSQPHAIEL